MINYERWQQESSSHAEATVILVNGHTRPLTDFRMFGRYLTKQGFQVIAVDNRGSGQSVVDKAFTIEDMVEDLVKVLEQETISQASLVGISMGGFISQTFATTYPRLVQNLVLISTAPSAAFISNQQEGWYTTTHENEARLQRYVTLNFYQRNQLLIRSMAEKMAKSALEGDFIQQAQWQRQAIKDFSHSSYLTNIKSPTLIVHGVQDQVISVEAARELARLIPDSKLQIFEDVGHLLLAEQPKQLYECVADFLLERTS